MSLDENLRDLRRHADDFERRVGFTYTVLDDVDVIVGCVYIYPSRADPDITEVRSWVTASRAELDSVLHETVDSWLAADWPFTDVRYRNRVYSHAAIACALPGSAIASATKCLQPSKRWLRGWRARGHRSVRRARRS